jgi:hypothetical protein
MSDDGRPIYEDVAHAGGAVLPSHTILSHYSPFKARAGNLRVRRRRMRPMLVVKCCPLILPSHTTLSLKQGLGT